MRTYAVPRLAPKVSELVSAETVDEALAQALTAARRTGHDRRRARDLEDVFPWLPEHLLAEALAIAREIESERPRAKALSKLIPYLSDALLPEALAAASEIENVYDRSEVLLTIGPWLFNRPAHDVDWRGRC